MAEGETLSGYQILEQIGQGGHAVVFRAKQLAVANRDVAVKIYNNPLSTDRDRKRFEREVWAAASLSGDRTVIQLYDVGTTAQGRPFIVMEYCPGGSLNDQLGQHGRLPAARVARTGWQIALALGTAHRARVLHRDVKPHNILLTANGSPVLADFGIALLLGPDGSHSATAGALTPAFAAPEVLRGRPATTASDVYSLGATLFTLLSGWPHRLPPAHARYPVPAFSMDVDALPELPGVPSELMTILWRATDPRPDARGDAYLLADDLANYLRYQGEAGTLSSVPRPPLLPGERETQTGLPAGQGRSTGPTPTLPDPVPQHPPALRQAARAATGSWPRHGLSTLVGQWGRGRGGDWRRRLVADRPVQAYGRWWGLLGVCVAGAVGPAVLAFAAALEHRADWQIGVPIGVVFLAALLTFLGADRRASVLAGGVGLVALTLVAARLTASDPLIVVLMAVTLDLSAGAAAFAVLRVRQLLRDSRFADVAGDVARWTGAPHRRALLSALEAIPATRFFRLSEAFPADVAVVAGHRVAVVRWVQWPAGRYSASGIRVRRNGLEWSRGAKELAELRRAAQLLSGNGVGIRCRAFLLIESPGTPESGFEVSTRRRDRIVTALREQASEGPIARYLLSHGYRLSGDLLNTLAGFAALPTERHK